MLLAFFCTMSIGWAQQVTEQSQLSNDKVYTLTSARAFLLYSEKVPNQICGSTGTSVGTVTQDKTDPKQQFRIEKIGENYYLYSVGAEKYVNSDVTADLIGTLGITEEEVVKNIMLRDTVDGQFTTVEDVANMLAFLANDQGALTGQSLRLTHGWAMM